MNTNLALKLVEIAAIKRETEIEATYRGVDLSGVPMATVFGTFIVIGAKALFDTLVFEGRDIRDGRRQLINSNDVLRIDGMDPVRFANIFGLSSTGEPLVLGKRRGRKPKMLLAA